MRRLRQRRACTRKKWVSVEIVCLVVTAGFLGFITFESDEVSAGTTWYVGSGPGNDTAFLGYAVTVLANPGDTVFVHSGVYNDNLWINKTITLIGEDRNTTIIDGGGGAGPVIQLDSADWVNITGFTIRYGAFGVYIVWSSYVRIQGNEIYGNNGGEGFFTVGSSNNIFTDNIVHDNTRHGFFFQDNPYPNNNLIKGNVIYNNGWCGIYFEDDPWNNWIINNTVYNNSNEGIFIELGTNNSIIGNIVHHNGLGSINPRGGIHISSSNDNSIEGNLIHNNQNGIILGHSVWGAYSDRNTIVGNMICNNNDAGIRLEEASDNTFIENSIFDNYNNVYMEQQSRDNNFINCSLSNATQDEFNITDDSHAILLNTTFNKTRAYYGDTLSDIVVMWFTHVHVMYYNGTPVSYAEVWINDTFGNPMLYMPVDSQGWIRWFVVIEYMEQDMVGDHIGDKFYRTPHSVTATDGSLWGYAEPFMDKSKTVTIILGNHTTLYLYPGWNLISLPIQTYPALKTVLDSIEGDYDAVQWFDIADKEDRWKHHHISKPHELNDLKDIYHTMGFWIHVTDPNGTTLTVYGDIFSFSQPVPLSVGWNQVGFPSLSNKTTTSALNKLVYGVEVDAIFTFEGATQTWEAVGPGNDFILGKGYWMHATQDCVWEVPL